MDKLDILDRKPFVDQLFRLIENISISKSSTCFAMNGTWGCGKSFVLDMLEEQLEKVQSEKTSSNKYFIIRYNCWKYDYYEEPLVAIVSTIISIIEQKTKLIPDDEKKRTALGVLKSAVVVLLSMANGAIKEKTGVDAEKAFKVISDGQKETAEAYAADHAHDFYFGFNKVMEELMHLLQDIAEQYTIIFMVDELDRCIPQYAIKVLERLHHLTEGLPNIITVISIDKAQLITSVKKTFGFENPEEYLEKFIQFEVKLGCGTVSEQISEKYANYMALFDRTIFPFEQSAEECLQAIFKDIPIRIQEHLMHKAMLVHKLLYTEPKDYSFMCMEVLLTVMICVYKDQSCFSDTPVNCSSFSRIFTTARGAVQPAFSDFFEKKFEEVGFNHKQDWVNDAAVYVLPERRNLYGAIIYTWYWMHSKRSGVVFQYNINGVNEPIAKNYEDLKRFAASINLIV